VFASLHADCKFKGHDVEIPDEHRESLSQWIGGSLDSIMKSVVPIPLAESTTGHKHERDDSCQGAQDTPPPPAKRRKTSSSLSSMLAPWIQRQKQQLQQA